ncbi:MAG: 30S ribosomal protein S16, partial [Planctomycetota bacterium]
HLEAQRDALERLGKRKDYTFTPSAPKPKKEEPKAEAAPADEPAPEAAAETTEEPAAEAASE